MHNAHLTHILPITSVYHAVLSNMLWSCPLFPCWIRDHFTSIGCNQWHAIHLLPEMLKMNNIMGKLTLLLSNSSVCCWLHSPELFTDIGVKSYGMQVCTESYKMNFVLPCNPSIFANLFKTFILLCNIK